MREHRRDTASCEERDGERERGRDGASCEERERVT